MSLGPVAPVAPPKRMPSALLIAAVAVSAAVFAGYYATILDLMKVWWSEPSYSHGFLVLPIALVVLYQRRHLLDTSKIQPNFLGFVALVAILALRSYLYERNEKWFEQATIPLAMTALVLAFGGWRLVWWALPALLFSLLMLPLPAQINNMMAAPLQTVATMASTALLQSTGLPVLSEGHVIIVGAEQLEVARACNGLSMLLSFTTLIVACALLFNDWPLWERLFLLLCTVPIALAANIIRIVITGWCYHLFGPNAVVNYGFGKTTVGELGHDAAGWGMMPIALVMVYLLDKFLTWLIVPETVRTAALVRLPSERAPRPIKK